MVYIGWYIGFVLAHRLTTISYTPAKKVFVFRPDKSWLVAEVCENADISKRFRISWTLIHSNMQSVLIEKATIWKRR